MTPERIAELRRKVERSERLGEPYHEVLLPTADLRALLAECERPWTAELPKESGWYWMSNKEGKKQILWVSPGLAVCLCGTSVTNPIDSYLGYLWSGPLSPPEQAGAQP